MDIQVRDCVFVSNSSSSLSLSISADKIFDINFSQEVVATADLRSREYGE